MTEQKAETLSQELSQVLEEIVTTPEEEVKRAVMVGDTTVMIDDVHYEIVEDYRDGFNIEALNELESCIKDLPKQFTTKTISTNSFF